jgi:hypothetical protein
MPERARTDQWEPWGSNPLGRPGPEPGTKYGVIVLDEGLPTLPEGMKVRIEPADLERELDSLHELLLSVAGKAQGLPPDLAEQHDHYLHGQPKR